MKHAGLIAICAGLMAASPAHASQTLPFVFVQCQGAEAMVRFEFGNDVAPLPAPQAERWKNVPFAKAEGCTLANGDAVIALQGDLQTSENSGGADPPGFFSLWIGGKKLISREFYKDGYGSYGLTHNSIHYAPGSLTRCTYPNATMEYTDLTRMTCARMPVNIAALPPDPQAPTREMQASFGKFSVMSVSSEAFCRSFVKPSSYAQLDPRPPILYMGFGDFTPQRELLASPPGTGFPMSRTGKDADNPFSDQDWQVGDFAGPLLKYRVTHFDLTNSGEEQTILRLWQSSKAFYGDIYLYRKGVASQAQIDAVIKADVSGEPQIGYRKLAAETGWQVAFAPDEVYSRIYAMPLRIEGVTYLFVYSIKVEATPTATLLRMKPGIEPPETVCVFQELRPAF